MKKGEVSRAGTELFDLPRDMAYGVPRIVLVGERELLVENHGGVHRCSEGEIVIGTDRGELVVEGEHMSLALLKKEELEVEGIISRLSFREKGEKRHDL